MATPSVEELMAKDLWGQHPVYTRRGWSEEVFSGSTQRGYWDWVQAKIEENESHGARLTRYLEFVGQCAPGVVTESDPDRYIVLERQSGELVWITTCPSPPACAEYLEQSDTDRDSQQVYDLDTGKELDVLVTYTVKEKA